jgi:chromate reductase
MTKTLNVLGISGSLRKGSYNTALLRTARLLKPDGMTLDIANTIGDLPLYNDDIRQEGYPPDVQDLRERVGAADALIFATPEYNHSVPGVLKNAIDWLSRPPSPPLDGKPAAIIGASTGPFGTARAQPHLRQILTACNAHVLNRPGVLVMTAGRKFNAEGYLQDETGQKFLRQLLRALAAWTQRISSDQRPAVRQNASPAPDATSH